MKSSLDAELRRIFDESCSEREWLDAATKFWRETHWRRTDHAGRKQTVRNLIFGIFFSYDRALAQKGSKAQLTIDRLKEHVFHQWPKSKFTEKLEAPSETLIKRYARLYLLEKKPSDALTVKEWGFIWKYDKNSVFRVYSTEEVVRACTPITEPRGQFAVTVCERVEEALRKAGCRRLEAPGYYQTYKVPLLDSHHKNK